jgi:methionyl-tRNA synthetase
VYACREAIFITGSDEHGEKIATTAQNNGMGSQEFVDKVRINMSRCVNMRPSAGSMVMVGLCGL